jgi:hypothetical protein
VIGLYKSFVFRNVRDPSFLRLSRLKYTLFGLTFEILSLRNHLFPYLKSYCRELINMLRRSKSCIPSQTSQSDQIAALMPESVDRSPKLRNIFGIEKEHNFFKLSTVFGVYCR